MKRILTICSTLVLFAACDAAPRDVVPGDRNTSGTYELFVANTDHGSIAAVDPKTGHRRTLRVGEEPSRLARHGDELYVTLRGERAVAIVDVSQGKLQKLGQHQVGAEPFGIVATDSSLYVASSMSGRVDELDRQTGTVTRSWTIANEPRWLAMHPGGNHLYVGSVFGGQWSHIDLASGDVSTHGLVEIMNPLRSREPVEPPSSGALAARITGDLAFTPDGTLLIPALYIDNQTVIIDEGGNGNDEIPGPGGYGNRFTPVVVAMTTTEAGAPQQEQQIPMAAIAFSDNGPLLGYPSSVTATADGQLALATIEGQDAVVAIRIAPLPASQTRWSSPAFVAAVGLGADAGPRAVLFDREGNAYAHSFFDNALTELNVAAASEGVGVMRQGLSAPEAPNADSPGLRVPGGEFIASLRTIEVAQRILPSEAEHGRRLFMASNNSKVSGNGNGVSCGTCHFDGRTDGLTWNFSRGPRQTPSLAGNVSASEPVGWQGDRATVAEDAMLTSQGLMGGAGLTVEDTLAIQSFVNFTRDIDNPNDANDPAVRRGQAIFQRADVGCASCHSGVNYGNTFTVGIFELTAAKIRPLNGIVASAPYFHDGSAATLRDVLERSRDGSMGDTSSLTTHQMDDLEAFLESL